MKISVCIPTFNSACYVGDCIRSVLAQQGVEFEVIVFDNRSEDDTWEIIKSFSDPRVRAFRSDQNRGMTTNFNCALQEARGEYAKLLCSDDLLEPSALELQAKVLDQHAELVMVTSARRLIDSGSNMHSMVGWFSRSVIIGALDLKLISLLYGNVVGEPSAVLFRRAAWLRAGFFRDGLVASIDLDMWFRLSCQGGVGYLPLPLCRIRRHALSMTNHFRGTGEVQEAVLQMTESLLRDLQASPLVRRISMGKVAGSHLRHALYGFRRGFVNWPATALAKAFRTDPAFIGLFLYLVFFRSGLMGLRIGSDGRPSVCATNTLHCLPEVGETRVLASG
jgi:glycosyltransferase involved in cell wall biosynthesis